MSAPYPVRADGRWSGRVTRRALPDDPSLAALPRDTRDVLARLWQCQAATEHRVATSFERVHAALRARGADAGLVDVSARAVDDEFRHAALCLDVASRYAGRALGAPATLPHAAPAHADAAAGLRPALVVLGQCALNETFAAAYLDACLEGATHPLARAALAELLSDEVDHARIGWAFAATLDDETRGGVQEWLLPLAIANLRMWQQLSLPEDPAGALVPHGVPTPARVRRALLEALEALVIPGFARNGFEVRGLGAWLAQGAPTARA
ncbi:MAG: hypothetical protein U0325_21755 [Polyangiales bacterium]